MPGTESIGTLKPRTCGALTPLKSPWWSRPGPQHHEGQLPGQAKPAPSPPLSICSPRPSTVECGGAADIAFSRAAGPGRALRPWKVPQRSAGTGLGCPQAGRTPPGRARPWRGAPRSQGSAPPSGLPPRRVPPRAGRTSLRTSRTRGRAGELDAGAGAGERGAGRCSPSRPRPSASLLRGRARQSGGKVRHKRQALQDMARPLKQWLYKHRDNPYPTKTEKILLALGSQMTLVQVRDPPLLPPAAAALGRFVDGRDSDSISQKPRCELSKRQRWASGEVSVQPARPGFLVPVLPSALPRAPSPALLYPPERNLHIWGYPVWGSDKRN